MGRKVPSGVIVFPARDKEKMAILITETAHDIVVRQGYKILG